MSDEFSILIPKDPLKCGEAKRDLLRRFTGWLNSCKPGLWRIEICQHRQRRTDRQNRYYWPCFVAPFAKWLTENWGENYTAEQAHEILKARFLTVEKVDPNTGELFTFIRSTTDLDTVEFNRYLDQCGEFLATYCGFVVPEPSEYHEREEVKV